MTKEIVLYPGVFTETCQTQGRITIEQRVRKVLLENGYPIVGNTCNQPNICDLLTDCSGIGGVCSINGITGTGLEDDCIRLGGDLVENTVIDTDTFDFSVSKDNVKLDINDAGGTLGSGETARFIGVGGTITAETGIYTAGGGGPSAGSRVFDSSTNFSAKAVLDTVLSQLDLECQDLDNAFLSTALLRADSATFGLTGSVVTTLVIKKQAFTGGTDVIQLVGLPTFADNAAATAAALPVDSLYKTAAGDLRIRA